MATGLMFGGWLGYADGMMIKGKTTQAVQASLDDTSIEDAGP